MLPMTRVLIADDSELVRAGLHELIEDHAGWFCTEAVNGRDAIAQIQHLAPDILILDLFMPVQSPSSYLISLFSSARLTSPLLWFPWRSVVEYKGRFRNITVGRL
jgi:CheY-like chemotaxis protein